MTGKRKRSGRIRLEEYSTSQRELLARYIYGKYPEFDLNEAVSRAVFEQLERELQAQQIIREHGDLYYVDRMLGDQPILPTPQRMGVHPGYTGKGVTIAFVDSGFTPHPDLLLPVNRVCAVYDAVHDTEVRWFERELWNEPPVPAWHGTMTACASAGSGYLSRGRYRGIAGDADVVLVKTMTPNFRIRTPQVTQALLWLRENVERFNIRVINLSVAVDETTDSLDHPVIALVEELVDMGVVVIAASGNAPSRPLRPPASAPSAITVGGYNDNNSLEWTRRELWHSSYGKTPNGVRKPELLGPAIWIAAPILLHTQVKAEAEALFHLAGADDETFIKSVPVLAPETGIAEPLLASGTMLEARSIVPPPTSMWTGRHSPHRSLLPSPHNFLKQVRLLHQRKSRSCLPQPQSYCRIFPRMCKATASSALTVRLRSCSTSAAVVLSDRLLQLLLPLSGMSSPRAG